MDVGPWQQLRAGIQVVLTTAMLIVIMVLLLPAVPNQRAAGVLSIAAWPIGGFLAGAKTRKPVQLAAVTGVLAYFGGLICWIYQQGVSPASLPETPCAPVCAALLDALFAAFGGWIAGRLLPCQPPTILPNACLHCGYDLIGNVSGICPECGMPVPGQVADVAGAVPPKSETRQD